MAKWFGAQYNQEVHFSLAAKCKKGPQVQTSLLSQKRNYYNNFIEEVLDTRGTHNSDSLSKSKKNHKY